MDQRCVVDTDRRAAAPGFARALTADRVAGAKRIGGGNLSRMSREGGRLGSWVRAEGDVG